MKNRKFPRSFLKLSGNDTLREMLTPESLAASTVYVLVVIGLCYIWLTLLVHFFPHALDPYSIGDAWKSKGSLESWVALGIPIYLWGGGITFLHAFLTRNSAEENRSADGYWLAGLYASLLAGVTEEIRFRWLYFYLCIISVKLSNFIFFGWLGLPLVKWIHVYIGGPVFNFLTFGHLAEYLVVPSIWFVGSALLIINGEFRDGHAYQGPIGLLNSWVLGFFFFWLALKFGLPAAIVVHVVYDALLFTIEFIDRKIEFFSGNR